MDLGGGFEDIDGGMCELCVLHCSSLLIPGCGKRQSSPSECFPSAVESDVSVLLYCNHHAKQSHQAEGAR
jgi:hypothetical protein